MAVKYRLYQNTRQGSEQYGLWYARASYDKDDEVGTTELARQISHATTLTPTDVRACIASFLYYINDNLRNGKKVKLETLGSFKVGLRTSPAKSAKEFTASANIKGVRVNFLPATHQGADKKRVINLLEGVKVQEQGTYQVDKGEKPEP